MHDFNSEHRFGSADYASEKDIRDAGLFSGRGLPLGFWNGKALHYDGDAPLLTTGGSGSGKCRDILSYVLCRSPGEPMLCFDPRGELLAISIHNGVRHGEYYYAFNPDGVCDLPQHACDPLDILTPDSPHLHSDCKIIAAGLVIVSNGKDSYFEERAQEWIANLMLALVLRDGDVSFPSLYRLVRAIESDPSIWGALAEFMLGHEDIDLKGAAGEMLGKQQDSPREFGSTMGTIYASLSKFLSDPNMRRWLEHADFSLRDLVNADPVRKVFFIMPAGKLKLTAGLARTFITVAMLYKERAPSAKRITIVVDEAAQYGRFDALKQLFSYGRGSGIRTWGIWQNSGQIISDYSEADLRTLQGSSQVIQSFGIRDYRSAEEISNRMGFETLQYDDKRQQMEARHRQRQAARRSLWDGDYLTAALDARHHGEAAQLRTKQARRLLTPDEALTLPEEGQLLFVSGKGLKPIYAQKHPYYTRLEMAGYYLPNPYHPPLDVVPIPSRGGARMARVITERVPAHLAHYPQHNGTISFVEGYRPY